MLDRIEVRYDGGESTKHLISAAELAESLQGFARIFGAVYHFATTGDFVNKAPAQDVQVFVSEGEAKCYNIWFELWEIGKQQQIFQGFVGNVAVAVVTYIVANAANDKTEMKHLALALQTALAQNGARDQSTVEKLLATVDKMAEALRPAARQAVAPIGKSCHTVRIGGESGVTIDADDKERMMLEPDTEITTERQWKAVITELDREKSTGKARLDGDKESRIPISITDPVFQVATNAYITAFVSGAELVLIGKAEISNGDIKRLHISNTA